MLSEYKFIITMLQKKIKRIIPVTLSMKGLFTSVTWSIFKEASLKCHTVILDIYSDSIHDIFFFTLNINYDLDLISGRSGLQHLRILKYLSMPTSGTRLIIISLSFFTACPSVWLCQTKIYHTSVMKVARCAASALYW